MKAHAESLAYNADGRTLSHPSSGYARVVSIELDDYKEVGTVNGELPLSDEIFPKGAPVTDYVKVGCKILKRTRG